MQKRITVIREKNYRHKKPVIDRDSVQGLENLIQLLYITETCSINIRFCVASNSATIKTHNLISLICITDITAVFTCDNEMEIFADGVSLGKDDNWRSSKEYVVPGNTRVISVSGIDIKGHFGILGSFSNGMVTDASWKCEDGEYHGWNSPDFDDSDWPAAVELAIHGATPWKIISGIAATAKWIWTAGDPDKVYCRLRLQ